jgi:hypothetical protein
MLEKRIVEEKDRYEKKLQVNSEELICKMKEDQQNYEEEIENLRDELQD